MTGERRLKRPARLVSLLILITGGALLAFWLIVDREVEDLADLFKLLAGPAFTAVGALIIARSDGNRVGWVVSATGPVLLASGVAGYLADQGNVVAFAIDGALWLLWWFLTGLLIFWFPTGSALSSRWRWVGWIGLLGGVMGQTYIVSDEICVEGSGGVCEVWVENPIGITGVPNPEYGGFSELTLTLLTVFTLLSVVSLIIRSVRARGVERLQIKWFLLAAVVMLALIPLQEFPGPESLWNLLFGLAVMAVPLAIGVAVLRYRLYEIDRIVSRTVSYILVVGLLALAYAGGFLLLTKALSFQSDLAVAGSTLAVAAMFNPMRRRVQAWVDRRFNRTRYDAQKVMDAFSGSLRDQVDPDGVVEGWVGAVSETMQPSSVGVWVREVHS